MHTPKSMLFEIVGLFVDDGRFASAIVIWLALDDLIVTQLRGLGPWGGTMLFSGLACILAESVLRCANR